MDTDDLDRRAADVFRASSPRDSIMSQSDNDQFPTAPPPSTAMYGSHLQVGALLPEGTAGMVGSGTRGRRPSFLDGKATCSVPREELRTAKRGAAAPTGRAGCVV